MKHYVIQLGPVTLRRLQSDCARPRAALRSTWTYDVLHGEVLDQYRMRWDEINCNADWTPPFQTSTTHVSQATYTSTGRENALAFYRHGPNTNLTEMKL